MTCSAPPAGAAPPWPGSPRPSWAGWLPTRPAGTGRNCSSTPRAAAALSLTLHELAVNAVKYGSLSVESGRVEVVWRGASGGGFNLEWLETGGPMTSPPEVRGFGMTLIEGVVGRELGGRATVEYKRSGVTAMIHAAADALVDEPEPDAPVEAPDASASSRPWAAATTASRPATSRASRC